MITSRHIADALVALVDEGAQPQDVARNVEHFLKRNNLTHFTSNILWHIGAILKRREEERTAHVSVGKEATLSAAPMIIEKLALAPDRHRVVLDDALIGGFRTRYEHRVYDATLQTQLQQLHEYLHA